MIKRKEFEKLFLPLNQSGKQIWVINRVKALPEEIVNMAIRMAELEFINFVRICDEALTASSENYPKRPKVPIVETLHKSAIGVEVLYNTYHQTINFFAINSPVKGKASIMVDTILKDLESYWMPAVLMDMTDGFWDKMERRYNRFDWMRG